MVLNYESPIRIYKYPFELVLAAYERRFPTCPLIPVFLGSEVLSEYELPDGSQRITERRCKIHVDAPYLLKKVAGVDYVFFIQKNDLNLKNRTLDIDAYNESFSTRIKLTEKCRYYVHPENSDWTCYEQSASLEILSFFGFENTIEKLAMKQYAKNVSTGKQVIEHFIKELKDEGITYIPMWQKSDNDNNCAKMGNGTVDDHVRDVNESDEIQGKIADITSKLNRQGSITSNPDCQNMLEAEYIRRYLGELTPLQESTLVRMKKHFTQLQKQKSPSDTTLLRFLRARDFNLDKAKELLSQSLIWRKKHNVDRILSEYEIPEVLLQYFPGCWHYHDKESRPLYILKLGQTDVKGLLKSVGENGLLKLIMHICEEGLRLTKEATRVRGIPITTWSLLLDLEGLNMRHYWRPGIGALLRIIEIMEANYPETLGRVLIVRTPRVFPILWTIVCAFIDEKTQGKFVFFGGNDYLGSNGLVKYIDESVIPEFLGGQSTNVNIKEGGLVPKSLYLPEPDLVNENFISGDDSIYNSVTLTKGQSHEVAINVSEIDSVITWDFDVIRQDVLFTVYFITKQMDNVKQLICDTKGAENDNTDKDKVEGPTTCLEGESLQGSHIAQKVGTYVLRWTFPHNTSCTHDTADNKSHKAQIMYYYELLNSSDYKGSVSSLQSAVSTT